MIKSIGLEWFIPTLLFLKRSKQKLLRQKGISIDIKRLRRLMRADGLLHRFHRKYVCTTDSEHDLPKAPNLLDRLGAVILLIFQRLKVGCI